MHANCNVDKQIGPITSRKSQGYIGMRMLGRRTISKMHKREEFLLQLEQCEDEMRKT